MKITLIQSDILWNAPEQNIHRAHKVVEDAAGHDNDLIIFPEMFTTGFSFPTGELARHGFNLGASFLSSLATTKGCYAVGTVPELTTTDVLYNTALLCKPDGSQEQYRKIHLFSFGDETALYSPGSTTLTARIQDVRVSFFICYDLRFPIPFYALAPHTDLFVVMANWPASRREHWRTLLRARAIENQAYVVGVNRVGNGGGLSYSGDSMVIAPDGSIEAELGENETTCTVDVSSERVRAWRNTFPALQDRRTALYCKMVTDMVDSYTL